MQKYCVVRPKQSLQLNIRQGSSQHQSHWRPQPAATGQKKIGRGCEDGYHWESLEELQSQTLKLINEFDILEKMSKNSIERANYFKTFNFCKTLENILGIK